MKYYFYKWLFLLVVFCPAENTPSVTSKRIGIICLTYDDGLKSQLDIAIPQLDSAGLKATFFLNSVNGTPPPVIGKGSYELEKWKRAAKEGHELGNHSLFHPCPEKLGWQKGIAIESYTIAKLMLELKCCDEMLTLIDGKNSHPIYAYPCNNMMVHDTDYSESLKKTGFIKYARAGGDENSIIVDLRNLNYMKVPSYFVQQGTSGNELIRFAEKIRREGGVGIYQFHGIDSQIFQVSSVAHKQLLDYLKQNQAEILVTTFSKALDLISQRNTNK